ncbi:MAG: hypothetical protein J6R30_08370 [Bacteroidales bacterium]|nr:hypothetical protein [Bacteroidales bacterium]
MATKINPAYYGPEDSFVALSADIKRSTYSIGGLFTNGKYTGGSFDATAAPWGIGRSSASSDYEFIAQRDSTWTINKIQRSSLNTPLYLYYKSDLYMGANSNADFQGGDVTSENYERAMFRTRTSPDAANDNGTLRSTSSVDAGAAVGLANVLTNYPITSLNYQNVRLYIDHVYYKPAGESTIRKCTMNDIEADRVSVDRIVYFDCRLTYNTATGTTPNSTNVHLTIGGNSFDIPDIFKPVYYQESSSWTRPWRFLEHFGYWFIDENWYDQDSFRYGSTDYINYKSSWETLGNSDFVNANPVNVGWSTLSDIQQNFNGLVYHWESGLSVYASDQWNISEIQTGDTYASGTVRTYAYLVIDEKPDDMSSNEAYFAAVLHECAFLGFPIALNHISVTHSIGDNDIYLPVFDEHMITTGEYVSGPAALQLINAEWTDIFGVDMPEYDPTYEPEPEPEIEDYGDTSNLGSPRGIFPNGVNIYVMSGVEYNAFIAELNSYYANSTPDDWTLDFQGVNPADYILAAYYTPYNFAKSATQSNVQIGNITLTSTAYKLSQGEIGVDPPNKWKYFSYGTRQVKPLFNDFRDYEPYTKVELYLPLAGSIELETSFVMNHNITVEYYFDVMTMSGVSCVYRDNLLYKTSDFKLGAQLPVLSTNMGAIQNTIVQLESSQKANSMRLAAGALTAAGGIAATIATGGAALPAMVAAGTGALSLAGSVHKSDELNYQIEHTAPSVAQTGAAEPMNNFSVGQLMPKLIIKRPLMLSTLNNSIYGHTVGHACCINNLIGNMSGLTVCSKIDTSGIKATVEEIQAIKQAFANGVYV